MNNYIKKNSSTEAHAIDSMYLHPVLQKVLEERLITQTTTSPTPPSAPIQTKSNKKGTNATVDPITDEEDIWAAQEYFLSKDQRYRANKLNIRNYALFTLGMNCSRRIGDLLHLKIEDVYFEDLTVKPYLRIKEQKTGKFAKVLLNDVSKDALKYYINAISTNKDFSLTAPLFKSFKKRDAKKILQNYMEALASGDEKKIKYAANRLYILRHFWDAIEPRSAWRIYNDMSKAIGLDRKGLNIGTHSTRKGWAHNALKNNPDDAEAILVVTESFNHVDFRSTRHYCGATQDMINDTMRKTQLGKSPEQIINDKSNNEKNFQISNQST